MSTISHQNVQAYAGNWVVHRFVRKHSGLHRAIGIGMPLSIALWLTALRIAGAI